MVFATARTPSGKAVARSNILSSAKTLEARSTGEWNSTADYTSGATTAEAGHLNHRHEYATRYLTA